MRESLYSFDDASGIYAGLVFARLGPPSFASGGLIVRRDIAERQLAEQTGEGRGRSSGEATTDNEGRGEPTAETGDDPGVPARPTRFFGSVEIDPSRPIRSFESVVTAVVEQLQRTRGAKVRLTLEIEAEAAAGFDDADVGVVRDNARQLRFRAESTGFD